MNMNPGFPPSASPMFYPNADPMSMMQPQAPSYDPRFGSYPRQSRRSKRAPCRHHSRRCRPVIHIIESDSCSTISSCSSIGPCTSRRYRTCSDSKQYRTPQQQQIILLPVQYDQQPLHMTGTIQGQQHLSLPHASSTPMIINPYQQHASGPQMYQAGPIQYVRAAPQLQRRFSTGSRHALVNSQN